MPRGNRKASLAIRLANIQPRGIVPPDEIPGSQTCILKKFMESTRLKYDAKKAQESFFASYSFEELVAYAQLIPHTISMGLESKQRITYRRYQSMGRRKWLAIYRWGRI